MKMLVYGAGALGSTVGGMLARAGHEVHLVGRNPHMKCIGELGLSMGGLWGTHRVTTLHPHTEIPEGLNPDWIFLTTKAFDTEQAGQALKKRFAADIPILHIQNGVGNAERLQAMFGVDRILTAMIIIGFQIPFAGRTLVTVQADSIKIGRLSGVMDQPVRQVTDLFAKAEMPVEAVNNVQMHLWGKVLYNASLNPLGAILGVHYGKLLDSKPWQVIEKLMGEAFAVLKAAGQPVFWPDAQAYLNHLRTVQIPATFDHQPSMLMDVRHGRRTEIDFINGALAQLGRRHQVATPTHDRLIDQIHTLETSGPYSATDFS